ncbi:terminase large subunit domain-containing protein [Lysinibacillus sp. NPDC096418]|uniref:terminase large subunit domain-containing protein n=1 Tax=Lysinibacillus sp. NPDC096418 TaxID=3364138 RepID=UPI00380B7734
MEIPKYVTDYIQLWRDGKITLNEERVQLIEWLKEDILTMKDAYFDVEMLERFITRTNERYFPLQPFQTFFSSFVFMRYTEDETLVFDEFLLYMARGGGKNGLISALADFFISELHGIENYNVSIVANSEKQAKTSFVEVYNKLNSKDEYKELYKIRKETIENNETQSVFQFHTSNAGTKDGLRDGCVIYDEIHQYEDSTIVDVFASGLGKVADSRQFYIGTDGYIRDGFIDKIKERAKNILERQVSVQEDSLFPFLCTVDDEEEMHDSSNWEKANPMFHKPLSPYAKTLLRVVTKQYRKLENDPSGYEEFVTKRMNLPKVDLEKNVTTWEKILSTDQEYDLNSLKGRECIGCVDYASIRDFVACGLLFLKQNKYILPKELTYSYVCKPFADKHYAYSRDKAEGNNKKDHRKFAPIREWEEKKLLKVLDKESMDPFVVVKWFVDMRDKEGWNIKKIIGDNFRMEILQPLFEKEGFEVEVIRNPDAASALLAPRIELAFDEERIVWGDNPLMRWYCNNVLVEIGKNGEKTYKKKERVKRKTDGFMMFLYGLWATRDLEDFDVDDTLDALDALNF